MNKKQETLVILMEECSEVIQECSKILRFDCSTEKLTKELGDLQCMMNYTASILDISYEDIGKAQDQKRHKLIKWSNIVEVKEGIKRYNESKAD